MQETKERLKSLLTKTDWTSEDRNWLLALLESEDTAPLRELLREQFFSELQHTPLQRDERAKAILEKLHERIGHVQKESTVSRMPSIKWVAFAASIMAIFFTAYFVYNHNVSQDIAAHTTIRSQKPQLLPPGGDKAVLTLSDGAIIILDDASEGRIAEQGKVKISKIDEGTLVYDPESLSTAVAYNSISTPKGGKFSITLSDGSRVWLNAASSLRFPVNFVGKERRVELTGEGYFEIAENKSKPFIVDVAGKEEVEVLGTHFNINAYSDESSINTTLLEGSIKVKTMGSAAPKFLSPGQQFMLFTEGKTRVHSDVDLDETIAWKNDKFDFGESTDLENVMRQIARWYDVEVAYAGKVSGIHLSGSISRNVDASKVFQMLELTGVAQFRISGKKVIVMAKRNQ